MNKDDLASPEWTKENVLRELRESCKCRDTVVAEVFLDDQVEIDSVENVVQQICESAATCKGKGNNTAPLNLLKIHRFSKAFSIECSIDLLHEISKSKLVKNILPAEIDDIYPKPIEK